MTIAPEFADSSAARVEDALEYVDAEPGLALAGRCVPAGPHGESIAGDFYDIFRLDSERLLVSVGDVSGHGPGAVARMTELRAATRAFAQDHESPVEVLRRLDHLLIRTGEVEDIATLWLGIYHTQTGLLRYASAGHPPPVIAGTGDRTILLSEAAAPPLGTGVVAELAPVDEIVLPVGAVLVAYSDGLVERPDRDLEEQLEVLRALVERALPATPSTRTPEGLVDAILDELVPDPSMARDDLCILVLRREATS